MGDLNNLIFTNTTPTDTSPTPGLVKVLGLPATNADGVTSAAVKEFAAVLQNSLAHNVAGKSGKPLPQENQDPAEQQALTGKLATLDSEKPEPSPNAKLIDSLLKTRSLKGGLQVIVGGSAPTDAGVDAFAKTQGIDPHALDALMGDSKKQTSSSSLDTSALPTESDMTAEVQVDRGDELVPDPIANWLSDSAVAKLIDTAPPAAPQQRQTIEAFLQKPSKFTMPDQRLIKVALTESDSAVAKSIDTAPPAAPQQRQTIEAFFQKPSKFTMPDQRLIKVALTEPALTQKLNVEAPVDRVEKLTLNIASSPALKGNMDNLTSAQRQQPAVKLDAINLATKETANRIKIKTADTVITSVPASNIIAPQTPIAVAQGAPAIVLGESGFISTAPTPDSRTEASTAQTLPEQLEQQSQRKQNEQADMSRRLAEALGQRLSAQISRGAWRVEMDLHPKSLGRIEIQLEMKNGEIEANFTTANAATRELLQESMPRLRDALEEHGMESAYIGLGLGNQAQSDGNSTAQNSHNNGDALTETGEAETSKRIERIDNDGLDILV